MTFKPIEADIYCAISAFFVVASQIVCFPLLSILYGQELYAEAFILVMVFLSFIIGEIKIASSRLIKPVAVLLGVLLLVFCAGFSKIVLLGVKSEWWRVLLTALIGLFLVFSGQSMLRAAYQGGKFAKNYILINCFAFGSVLLWAALMSWLGLAWSLAILGGGSIIAGVAGPRISPAAFGRPIMFSGPEVRKSVLLGCISSGFVAIFFRTVYLGLFPTSFEFYFYLAITFFLLACSAGCWAALTGRRCAPGAETAVFWGVVLALVSQLAVYSWGFKQRSYFDPVGFFLSWPQALQQYWIYAFVFCAFFLLPYAFFAAIVPAQQARSPGINHLFFCGLGNFIGLAFFGFIFLNLRIWICFALLVMLTAFLLFLYSHGKKGGTVLHVVLLAALFFCLPSDLDERMGVLAQRMRTFVWEDYEPGAYPPSPEEVRHFTISGGAAGYFYQSNKNVLLGMGGYATTLTNSRDLQKGLLARDFLTRGTRRVLLLGAGNLICLQQVHSGLQSLGADDFRIDVVDNFAPFFQADFRRLYLRELGFQGELSGVFWHRRDALTYMANYAGQPYDLIVWNLSMPNYFSSGKLYSMEGSELLAGILSENGVFLAPGSGNGKLDCTIVSAFASKVFYPGNFGAGRSVIVASKGSPGRSFKPLEIRGISMKNICREISPVDLSHRFSAQSLNIAFRSRGLPPKPFPAFLWQNDHDGSKFLAARLGKGLPVGAILPLTGVDATRGKEMAAAAELYFQRPHAGKSIYFFPVDYSSHESVGRRYLSILNDALRGHGFVLAPFLAVPDRAAPPRLAAAALSARQMPGCYCAGNTVLEKNAANTNCMEYKVAPGSNPETGPSYLRQGLRNVIPSIERINGRTDKIYVVNLARSRESVLWLDQLLALESHSGKRNLELRKMDINDPSACGEGERCLVLVDSLSQVQSFENVSKRKSAETVFIPMDQDFQEYLRLGPALNDRWVVYLWHPLVEYLKGTDFSSCAFAGRFYEKYRRLPTFYAAAMYGTMEFIGGLRKMADTGDDTASIPTIWGQLDAKKMPLGRGGYPVIAFRGAGIGIQLWKEDDRLDICSVGGFKLKESIAYKTYGKTAGLQNQ